MAIYAQAVTPTGPMFPGNPLSYTMLTGTSAQVITSTAGGVALVLNLGGPALAGRYFDVIASGNYKSHGASQTLQIGFQASAFSTGTFSGTSLGLSTASGTMTAGSFYPFFARFRGIFDANSLLLTGALAEAFDGVTPTLKAPTVTANMITSLVVGSQTISATNATNPLANANNYILQFAVQLVNGVSDTAGIFQLTDFHVEIP